MCDMRMISVSVGQSIKAQGTDGCDGAVDAVP
jgi:hypothetical protein